MKFVLHILSVFWLWTCSDGGDKATGPEEPPIVVNLTSLTGQAQKGPFNNGTSINVAELNNTLSPTGRNFSSAITDNTGRFSVANVQLESPFVELRATGFYFNEVSNNISDAQLTLYALSDLTNKTSLNVNILTHLEKNRMQVLMSGDNPKTFAQAKLQAQEEVLAIFDYSRANMPASELLDISQGGAANAKLLAISAILQGDQTVGQMSELLANISTDLSTDGALDDSSLQSQLISNTQGLDFTEIRSNLSARFTALGITATIPDFETEINQFLKPPVAQDMSVSTGEDTPINITLAASDPEDESLTYTILEVNNATVTLNGNVATYTPDAHFNGTDTFTFYANDGTSDSNIATVTMTVSAEDDEPNTLDVATSTDEDVAVAVNLSAEEYDGDSYSFAIITDVSNGTTSLNGSTVTYTPNQDWNGTDTFTFEATDDRTARTNVATATITVNPVNDAPVANDITNQVTDENRMMQLDITLDATDVDGDALTYNITSTNNGSVTINDNIATYVPTQDWNGEDTFTYVANDGALDSNSATVTITINSVNDAPVISSSSFELDEDSTTADGIEIGHSFVTDVDETTDGSIFSGKVILVTAPENGSLSQIGGTVILDVGSEVISGNSVKYHPNQNYNGTDSFTWKANDGLLDSNIATVTITVNPINDAPVANDITAQMDENRINDRYQPVNVTLEATDVEGDDLTYVLVSEGNYGTAGITNDILTYTPNQDWNGTTTLLYKANDGSLDSNTATVTITVNSVNDAPVTSNITQTQDEDDSEASDLSSFTSDVDGDDLTYSIVRNTQVGLTLIDGSIVTFNPPKNWSGTDSFTYKASDGTDDSNISTVTLSVNPVNDSPITTNTSISTEENNNVLINLTNNVTDVDNEVEKNEVIVIIDSAPSNGSLYQWDGSTDTPGIAVSAGTTGQHLNNFSGIIKLWYVPQADYYGTDSFSFKAQDQNDNQYSIGNTSTVSITVNKENEPPIIDDSNSTISIDMISNYYPFSFTLNTSDPEDDIVSLEIVQQPNNGSISVGTNNLDYNSTAHSIDSFGGKFGEDSFIVKAYDGKNYSAEYTFNLDISWQNHLYGRGTVISGINSNDDSGYFFLAREFIDYESFNLFKVSKDGNPLWIKEVSDFEAFRTYNFGEIIQSFDGSIYAAVSYTTSVIDGNNVYAMLIKFDEDGNELWRTKMDHLPIVGDFGNTGADVAFSLIEDANGDIIVGTSSQESLSNRRMTIWKLDTSGNLIFKKFIDGGGSSSMEARAVSISDDSSGNYYVLGTNQNKVEIRKVDNDGEYINRIIIGEGCNRCDPKYGFGRISKYNNNYIVSFVDAAVAYLHIYDEDLNPVMTTNFDTVENLGDWLDMINHVEFNQDIYTVHNITNSKSQQAYISKFTDGGGLISQIDYGGDENDHVEFIFHDGENLIFGGNSRSFKQNNVGNHPYYWISKIDPSGNKLF